MKLIEKISMSDLENEDILHHTFDIMVKCVDEINVMFGTNFEVKEDENETDRNTLNE